MAVGTRAVPVRSFAWAEETRMSSVGEDYVSETVQDTDGVTVVGCIRQVRAFVSAPPVFFLTHLSRILSVHILRSNAPGLGKLLPLLPNLGTLEVLTEDYESSIERSFKSIQLPQIRTLVIDAQAHYFMRCCTNVKRVIIHQRGFDVTYLESIPFVADSMVYLALCLPAPENIQGVDVFHSHRGTSDPSRRSRSGFVRLCPNLEELSVIQVGRVSSSQTPFARA